MPPEFPLARSAADALRNLGDYAANVVAPTLRIGVTGLARSGKTVFTTALVHNLLTNAAMPAFRASAEGRIRRARLAPQPDDAVPRFPYEEHLAALVEERRWPHSTTRINELRIAIDYERGAGAWLSGPSSLTLDIVDYPGEWLLDLALLDEDFESWSRATIAASDSPDKRGLAREWREHLATLDPASRADESVIGRASDLFKAYLFALRDGPESVATTPPGRFLMPGDLAGSPALTFAPLALADGARPPSGSLGALMRRRYDAYLRHVVRPFFRDHFQRIDRQIVLIDVLAAIDSGPLALAELERALDRVLMSVRAGRNSVLSSIFAPRADRVLFAATKADHLHQVQHRRLEAILRMLVERAMRRVQAAGAQVGAVALASLRATHETTVRDGAHILKAVAGTPEAGERIGDEVFDGHTEAAVFPGDLPEDPTAIFRGAIEPGSLRFPRFRPASVAPGRPGGDPRLPFIRLDRALEFLIGDRLP
ncbi:MAG: YcjX family protein [Salinarimonadaceae bacterium]|nr:MAG: YcjX family protein [Salinarimonadaceae bacterium]